MVAGPNMEGAQMQKDPSQASSTYVEFDSSEYGGGDLLQLPEPEREPDDCTHGITLQQQSSGRTVSITTTGSGSDLMVMVAISKESDFFCLHFGVALITNGTWCLDKDGESCRGTCLLIHHMGGGIYVEVWPDLESAKTGMQVYTPYLLDVCTYNVGDSSADLEWFLGEAVLNKHLQRKYSKEFTKLDGKFFEYGETNCLRLAMDVLLSLKAPPEIAKTALGVGRQDEGPRSAKDALIIFIKNAIVFLSKKEYLCEVQKLIDIVEQLKVYPHPKVQQKFIQQLEKTYHLKLVMGIFLEASESDKLRHEISEHLRRLLELSNEEDVSEFGIVKAIVKAYKETYGNFAGYGRAVKHLSTEALAILFSKLGI